MKMKCIIWIGVGICMGLPGVLPVAAGQADGLLGAREVMRRVAEPEEDAPVLPGAQLKEKVRAFEGRRLSLVPEVAAAEWLALVDDAKAAALGEQPYSYMNENAPLVLLMEVLPGPDAWEAIRAGLQKRVREGGKDVPVYVLGLDVLLAALGRDGDAAVASWKTLCKRKAEKRNKYSSARDERLNRETLYRLRGMGDDAVAVAAFEELLATVETGGDVVIPELLPTLGEEKTRALLLRALQKPGVKVSAKTGGTKTLVQRMIVDLPEMPAASCWGLVDSTPDGLAVFEALVARSLAQPPPQQEAAEAEAVAEPSWKELFGKDGNTTLEKVVRGYLQQEDLAQARLWVERCREDFPRLVSDVLLQFGWCVEPNDAVFAFIEEQLTAAPDVQLLSGAISVAKAGGQWSRVEGWLADFDARDASRLEQAKLAEIRVQWLLHMDRVEEAVALLRAELEAAGREDDAVEEDISEIWRSGVNVWYDLAGLLERPEWRDESLAVYRRMLGANQTAEYWYGNSILKRLNRDGAWRTAEEFLLGHLRLADAGGKEWQKTQTMQMLLQVYGAAERWEDVLFLLQQVPDWEGARDARDLDDETDPFVAAALYAAGQTAAAMTMVKDCLLQEPGDDWTYRLLMDWEDDFEGDLLAYFDWVFSKDPFEERPLIWKAKLLLKRGDLAAAEAAARQALVVDPTDGEQDAGERAEGYAVLADVLDAQGRADEAQVFRNVHRAVRVAEKGDELAEADLWQRSLAVYLEAEAIFPAAYCVQWRIAEKYRELGQLDLAQKHYEQAFEQMPGQFGRAATWCFGCMNVFEHAAGRRAAETVLPKLAAGEAPIPQVYYLLGELYDAEKKFDAAEVAYARAVEMDPLYVDALDGLLSCMEQRHASVDEQEALRRRLIELSPSLRHVNMYRHEISDWAHFWRVRDAWLADMPPRVAEYLTLTASVEKNKGDLYYSSYAYEEPALQLPGKTFGKSELFQGVARKMN